MLPQFQAQVSLLAQSGYSSKQNDHVASLAAASFCCSQVEYILQSWSNGDLHLQGMASLLQACGPSCLKHEDVRNIFYDHSLLWMSCSVVHRRPVIYSQWPWTDVDWTENTSPCESAQQVLGIAERIPSLLEEYDTSHQHLSIADMFGLLQRLAGIIDDMEALNLSYSSVGTSLEVDISNKPDSLGDVQRNHGSLSMVVATGYSSAFVVHAAATAWRIVRSQEVGSSRCVSETPLSPDHLQDICERHVKQIRYSITKLCG